MSSASPASVPPPSIIIGNCKVTKNVTVQWKARDSGKLLHSCTGVRTLAMNTNADTGKVNYAIEYETLNHLETVKSITVTLPGGGETREYTEEEFEVVLKVDDINAEQNNWITPMKHVPAKSKTKRVVFSAPGRLTYVNKKSGATVQLKYDHTPMEKIKVRYLVKDPKTGEYVLE